MAYVAVDESGQECVCEKKPTLFKHIDPKGEKWWYAGLGFGRVELPKGSIEKLIGRKLTWEDEPVELKGE